MQSNPGTDRLPGAAERAWARLAVLVLILGFVSLGAAPARAAEARFGDSTWVAPYPVAESPGDPTADGPRVGTRDHEPVGQTVLRAPFRVAFLPLRLVARGLEFAAGALGPRLEGIAGPTVGRPRGMTIRPAISHSSTGGVALGLSFNHVGFPGAESRIGLLGTWSWNDHRHLRVPYTSAGPDAPLLVRLESAYDYVPNRRFYGIGNFSSRDDRSIYLEEGGGVGASIRIGRSYSRQLRLLGGYSGVSSRRGYNDSPAVADLFTPAEVPFLLRESRMFYYGGGVDVAVRDDAREPSLGLHGRAEVRRFDDLDDSGVRYTQWHLEGRGYLPVFAKRRVIAVRALYRFVDPDAGSAAIPFYRLPVSKNETAFSAYKTDRFRDAHLAIGQVEYRWAVWQRLQAVALAQIAEVASTSSRLRIDDIHESYGGALRWPLSEQRVVRVEAAHGAEGTAFRLWMGGDF